MTSRWNDSSGGLHVVAGVVLQEQSIVVEQGHAFAPVPEAYQGIGELKPNAELARTCALLSRFRSGLVVTRIRGCKF
jgi:hypothetical protein